jgi:hypothetical protein
MISFKHFLIENVNPLTEVDSGHVPNGPHPKSGYEHRLFHAEIPNDKSPEKNANLWITLLKKPNSGINEFHFTTNPMVGPDDYEKQKNELIAYGLHNPLPAHVMSQLGLMTEPGKSIYGPSTMFHVFQHVKNMAETLPSGEKIVFDSGPLTKQSSIYRKYVQRYIASGRVKEIPSAENIITLQKV